ncbi:MAG: phenylacetate--CoA ligase family protein [Betaproteobacteria bacterium]|nr:MAG: phenylacetate--CoA ligase family protein [Betaproteobacteria bacterium]
MAPLSRSMSVDFRWPASETQILKIQAERKRVAVERAMRSPFLKKRIPRLDLDRLDDPDVWRRIPVLTKEDLRQIPPQRFHDEFCIQPRTRVVEYWRSGGATGRPLFYPRSAEDMQHNMLIFERAWALIGATAEDCAHISFPLGVHPVAHLYARAAINLGIGTVWCGAGNNTPSETQLELIDHLEPTVWIGMASYGLHLANLAEVKGFNLKDSAVKKIIVAAEPLSPVKREKLERAWGAEVFDHFGMTEGALVSGEAVGHHGLHAFADMYYLEVIDEQSGEPVADGEIGSLIVTPLWSNSMTPFLRWSSGDLVSLSSQGAGDGPWSVYPVMRHARRTVGFFKVRGVNINHSDLEDTLFRDPEVVDFRAELFNEGSNDVLHLHVEMRAQAKERVIEVVKRTFQVTPRVTLLERGTIAREFEADIKAPRFVDKRG